MTALFSTHRRAEEFAAAVDGCSSARTSEMESLVGVATALRTHESLEAAAPRDEFVTELRALLLAEAERMPANAPLTLPVRRRGPRERRLVVAASAFVFLGGTAGMAAAAQQSLPGEALYPIKRGIERAEAGLSVTTAGRGQDLLHQASGRLAEVEGLLADGSLTAAPQIPQTVDDFTAQAREGSNLLMASYEESGDPETIVAVREFTAEGITLLKELARTAPAEAQDELASAAMTLAEIDRQASELCASCAGDLPELEVPGIFLAASEANRAFALIDGRLLDNSHPVVVDKRAVTRPDSPLGSVAPPAGSQAPAPAPAPAAPGTDPAPSLGLPDVDDVTRGGSTSKPAQGGKVVGDIRTGLGDVVETLLPETDLLD